VQSGFIRNYWMGAPVVHNLLADGLF